MTSRPLSTVHPRGCGESRGKSRTGIPGRGPSPRVRGIHAGQHRRDSSRRSIPAGAGNPASRFGGPPRSRVHPCGCGESRIAHCLTLTGSGPSPRVRGILVGGAGDCLDLGSIPAGAGNPCRPSPPTPPSGVHPRGCGESGVAPGQTRTRTGPSPRVRGIPRQPPAEAAPQGSIPAGAGNPRWYAAVRRMRKVHPRGCGESLDPAQDVSSTPGPSPRVRGILWPARGHGLHVRSIPAGAGNPLPGSARRAAFRVHPRGCGESPSCGAARSRRWGPSPRVRGIRSANCSTCCCTWSIPAGAGNPRSGRAGAWALWVHPRGCGESDRQHGVRRRAGGPSPRVRGIHGRGQAAHAGGGSIPAGAGNPARTN